MPVIQLLLFDRLYYFMNREIKFRVWDNIDYMSTPFTLHDLQLREIQFTITCPVMQYTGLKDRNGKEIYEGDIVRTYMGNICEIKWDKVYEVKGKDAYTYTGFCFHQIEQKRNYHLDITSSCEIIGNIYENSELIK